MNRTIGLISCKSKSKLIAEYVLRNITTPLVVSEYVLTRAITEELKTSLPSVEEIEKELDTDNKRILSEPSLEKQTMFMGSPKA